MNFQPQIIETPCPVWARLLSITYDLILSISLLLSFSFFIFWIFPSIQTTAYKTLIIQTYSVLLIMSYYVIFWYFGQTPGMRVCKLYWKKNENTSKTNILKLLKRFIFSLLFSPFFFLCLFDKEKKTLVDKICRVRLVKRIAY